MGKKITIMWRDPFKPVLEYVLSPIMFFFKTGSIILKYIITPAREKKLKHKENTSRHCHVWEWWEKK